MTSLKIMTGIFTIRIMIFLDTGAFLARFIQKDQYHLQAVKSWKKIQKDSEKCATSNFVLDETLTLLGRRAGYQFAYERARNIYASKALLILRPDQNDEIAALDYFSKYGDHAISFTDCISFTLMDRMRIKRVFTFDKHFSWAGYSTICEI